MQYETCKSISSGTLTPFSTDSQCPLDPGVEEFKFYAHGSGLIKDDLLELVDVISP